MSALPAEGAHLAHTPARKRVMTIRIMPGRREVLDDMRAAIRSGRPPLHDGRWGKATLEVALAVLRSASENREVMLEHQVAVPVGF